MQSLDIEQLQKTLRYKGATKTITYVPKEEAAARYIEDIGEDFGFRLQSTSKFH